MRKVYLFLGVLGLVLGLTMNSIAQISHGGTPPSITYKTIIDSTFDEITIAPINVALARQEDDLREGPLWAGRSIPVGVTMQTAGTWSELPGGGRIWRLKITSAGANALGVTYDQFYIPEGGQLFLYNATKTQIIGSYTHENNPESGVFATELVQGESVILEYYAPADMPTKDDPQDQMRGTIDGDRIVTDGASLPSQFDTPRISIAEIVYVYREVAFLQKYDLTKQTGWGTSDVCQVNVNCSPAGDAWQDEKRGVAEIWLNDNGSWGWCTGTLVNTTNNSGTPYFLTANHCGGSTATDANLLVWAFYFKYEALTCTTPGTEPSYSTITGCTRRATGTIAGGSDFFLVELNTTPPQSYNPYYNGWDRNNTAWPATTVGIHHPSGDIKKISYCGSTLVSSSPNIGGSLMATNSAWQVTWAATGNGTGCTEGGSSGSPLFNAAGRQVGTLSGGSSSCASPTSPDYYGKFSYHWDQNGAANNVRLKPWLDPGNVGSTFVNGYDPFSGFPDFYGTPTTVYEGETVTFTDITNGATSWSWVFEGGAPATSTAQVPGAITYNQQGVYKVKLTTTTPTAGLQTQEKLAYITVLAGPRPTSFWCDNFSTPANWTMTTSGGYTDAWIITTAAPTGTYSGPLGRINSTSGGNYALFDSDALGSAGDNQWANITTTNGQNCTTYGSVILQFQQNYRKFYDSTLVYVSTNNFVTSTRYVVNGDYANNGVSTNPDLQEIDISSAAAGQTNVKVRFTFRSTQNMSTSAGWGYAWEIDDVCLIGVAPGNDLPQPDFAATTSRDISPGQTVNFQDLSQYATSWLWTFDGGTPSTSTAQNPTGIVYNTGGYYAVTLTATNQNGSVSTTKTDYIHVFDACSFDDSNIEAADDISYYFAPGAFWGYTPGHNGEGITAYADKVTNNNLTGLVKSFAVAVGEADSMAGITNVTFTIWNDNAGVPGTVLMTKSVPVYTLAAGSINFINFAPVAVTGTYYVGFQINYPATVDTFACFLSSGAPGRTNTAYVYNGASWVTYESKYGINASLYILPEFCLTQAGEAPVTDFVASQTSITPGTVISFTDQTTGGSAPTAWTWALPGGAPAAPVVQNPPTVTYGASGLYDATLIATNSNGSDTELKAGYIHVAPITNIVYWNFPNVTDNAIADGGIAANLARTITNWGAPTAQIFTTAGATTRCASTTKWNDANAAPTGAWSVTFTTSGYTDIHLSSKQAAGIAGAPRDFEIYYSVNGAPFAYLTAVPQMTTVGNWNQGRVDHFQMPADCDNATSIEVVWYKVSDLATNGTAVTATATSLIDDILITGQACTTMPGAAGTITGLATVCQGQTGVVYTVPVITGATYYNWTVPAGATIVAGNYTNAITVDFAQNQVAGNITVRGENICGLGTISPNKPIAVNPVPVAPGNITGLQSVTNGQNGVAYSVAAVSGATTYTWTLPSFATQAGGGTTENITVNFACPGDFGNISVHANNACGAGPESYVKAIAITCPPVANFYASPTTFCPGGSAVFTDISTNNPTSWSWTFTGGSPASSTLEHPTVVYATAGSYAVTLTVTNANGSDSETKTGYINVVAPGITFTNVNENPVSACNGQSTANVSGTSPFTYSWTAFNDATTTFTGTTGTITNNATSNFTAAVAGIGNLDGTIWSVNQVCISASGNRNQDMDISLISPIGTIIDLSSDNGTTVTTGYTSTCFKQSAATLITAATEPFTGTFRPEVALTTLHTGQNPNGTWTLRIIDDANQGGSGTLASWNISFNSHIQQTTQTVTNLCSGSYTVTVTDANGCTATASTTITASAGVTASISASTNVSCFGGNNGSATVTASSGTAPYTYDWSPNGFTGDGTVTYSNLTAGTYTVTVTDATAGTATASIIITQPSQLTAIIGAQTNATCSFSTNGSATVTAGAGTAPYSYDWAPNGYTGDGTVTYSALIPGTYTVTVTDNRSCTATTSAVITALNADAPVSVSIAAVPAGAICTGTSVTFTATPTNGGAAPAYQWKVNGVNVGTGLTYTSTTLATGNTVTCVLTSNATCPTGNPATSNTITMTVNAVPTVSATATPATVCAGTPSSLAGSGATSYTWMPGSLSGSPVSVTPGVTTTYTVTGTASGCTASNTVLVTVNPVVVPSVAIALTTGTNPMCAGASATFTATPTNGGATPSYQWRVNGVNAGANSPTFTTTTLTTGQIVTCVLTSNATCASPTTATSTGITMTVNPVLVPSVSIALTTGTNPMCAGASATFTATPTNGGATPSYQWRVNGVNAGANSPTFTTTTLTTGQIVTCVLTSNATCASPTTATSTGITMTVNPVVVPSVSIALTTGTNPMCAGASATFTATPTNGGATPSYQWKVNGVNAGINSPTFTTTTLTTGQIVTCQLTSNATCASPSTATSAGITMTVNPVVVPSVSIALTTGSNPMCAGASATFTATPTNGGATPAYQWQVNGVNAGINSNTFTTTTLTTGQIVTCILTSNATCASPATATSTGITMTINPVVVPSVSIDLTSGNNPSCAGSSVTFTATPTNGGATPSYQWQVNGVNAGANSPTFTTTTLTTGQIVTCILTSNATCASPTTATSTGITMTVNPVLVPSVAIAITTGSNPTCTGSSVTFTATPTNGGAAPAYQWQVNGANVGTNSPTYTTSALITGQIVTCILTSNATCASPTTATSAGITMTVNAVLAPSVAIALTTGSNPSCAGSSLTFTATPTNGGATPAYQWQVNGANVGANSPTYTSATITTGQVVTCIMTSSSACASPTTATSTGITMTVNPVVVPSVAIAITTGSNPSCAGSSMTFTATPTNGGATPAYQWQVNGTNAGINSNTFTTTTLTTGQIVTCILTSNASCASPTTATSAGITMTVNPVLVPSVAIALTTGTNPMCAGSSATFTATPTNGGATPAYQWQVNGVNAGINSNTFTTTTLTTGQIVTCILTSNATCASPTTATSAGITMTVNPVLVPSVSIALTTGSNPMCAGSSATFTATPTNGGATPSYQWQVNGSNVGANSPTYTTAALTTGQIVTCILTSNATCASPTTATSAGITMIVNPVLVPSVAIALTTGTNPMCAGSSATFTATPTNGGAAPVYQWQVNGVNAGINSNTFTTTTLTTGQIVTCILTSNVTCASPTTATSAGITMTVNPVLVPAVSITITTGSNPSCAGTAITFTATPTNGGAAPVYQWQVNGSNVGANSPTYTTSALTTGQIVTCILTSNATCASPTTATSAGITMTVNPVLVPSVAIAITTGSNPSCAGSAVTFTATPTNGGATPSYQWQVNGSNVGSNSPTYTTAALTTGQIVTCILTSNATCASPATATSAGITMTVNPVLVPSVAIALTTGSNPSCAGSSVTFTATPTNGGATPAYQWQVNGVNAGTNSATYTTSGLTNGQIVTCILTSNATCASPNTATSTGITMTVNPVLVPSVAIALTTGTNPMCAGSSATFTATPTNGGATPSYQWQVNSVNAGINSNTFTTTTLTTGQIVTCILTSNATCASPTTATSAGITMTVNPVLVPSVAIALTTGTNPMCAGSSATFTATPTNGGTTPAYQWQVNGVNAGINSNTFTTTTLTTGQIVTCILTSNATCASPTTATSAGITMTVNPVLVPSVAIALTTGTNPMCAGSSATFTATPTNGGATPAYQWQVDGVNAGANSNTFTTTTLTTGQIVTCILTSNATCASPTTATSAGITMTVNPVLVPSVAIALTTGTNPMCAGSSATFTATPTNGGTTPAYQWQVNGINAGTNSNTFTTTTLSTGQIVTCILTSNATCASPTTATSAGITMTVNPVLVPAVAVALTTGSNPSCAGSSLTFTATPTNGGATPAYQWQVNGVNAGTNSATYTTSGLTNGQIVTCILTSNATCASPTTASSAGITMTVNPVLVPSVAIALTTGTNPMCAGSSATFTATPTNGGATPAYQWQVNGINAGTNSNTFTTTTLTTGQIVTCILTSNATCASPTTATSTGITMTVNPVLVPSVAIALTTGTNPMCAGSSATFTATPTNGGAIPAYQWQVNGINAGTNSNTFTTTTLTTGQIVTCILTSNATCASPATATSAGITMTVNPVLVPSVAIALTTGTNPMCAGSSATFTATPTNGGATPAYQWQVDGVNAGLNSNTFTTTTLTTGQIVTCILTSNATCASPTIATSAGITMTVNPVLVPSVTIALTTGTNPMCAGSSATFTAAPTNGGAIPAYQWQVNGINAGTNSNTFTTTTLTTGQIVTCILTSNATCASPATATSAGITMTVNPVLVPAVAIAITAGSNPSCAGSSLTFTATPTNGGATPAYQWQVNGVNTGANSPTYTTSGLSNGQIVTCILTSNATCASPSTATSTGINMTINPVVVPSVAIALTTGSNPMCAGSSATFTATPTNGGATPAYQWQVNGVNAGTNSATFTTATLTNGQIVTCILTSNATCASPTTATSAGITMTVNATLVPAVAIAVTAGSNPTCAGASMTFTATPTNGGGTPSYQWQVNAANVGANSPTYTTSGLTNGQIVTCIMTSGSPCASPTTATSAGITITVNATLVPAVAIALTTGSNPMCAGSSATFTATPTNGGATPSYQWQVNGSNVGSNSPTYTTAALTTGQIVTCIMTSNSACASPTTATSAGITMTVNPVLVPSVAIALTTGTNPMCAGSSATFTATPTNGGTTPAYQWQVNGVNAGINSNTFTTTTLTTGQIVTCILTSNATCASPTTASSAGITMTVNPVLVPSVAIALTAGTNPMCAGSSATFTATPTNGGATPAYQWQVNGVNAGINSNTFTTTTLTTGQIVTCILTSNATCASPSTATSAGITMTVNPVLVPSVAIALTTGTNPMCAGASATFTATPTNGGATPAYQWQVDGVNAGTNSNTFTTATLTTGQIVTCILTSNATCASPATATSAGITMTVNPVLVPSVAIALTTGTNPMCAGSSATFTATSTNGGATPAYQWQVDGVNAGTNSNTFTTTTLTTGQIVTCILTSNATCASPTSATSAGITMTVNPVLVPSVAIALTTGTNPMCAGSSATFTATPTNGGTTPAYQWQVDGVNAGINSNTFTTTTLTTGQIVTCILTSNATCASPTTATSTGITMTVNPVLVPSVAIALTTGTNPMCAGSSTTFTATPTNGGATPAYQWQVNGVNAGTNSPTYTTAGLTTGQIVTCILTSNATCASPTTATSTGITMTVNPVLVPSVTIALTTGTNPMCAGASATFTATPTNGGATPAYQWQVDGVNAGTNSNTFTTTTLTTGQIVTCILTSNATCASPTTATSAGITMTVNPVLVPSVAIALTTGSNPMCAGASATFTATPTNGGAIPAYQWQVDGVNAGINSATFTTSALNNGEVVTCILTSNATCASPATATSAGITMTVNATLIPAVSIAVTSGSNPTCAGASITFTATPTNGGATPAYQWQVDGVNVGLDSPTYTTSGLTNGQVVTCILTSSSACASPSTATSAGITITVNATLVPAVAIAITAGSNPMCIGSSTTFTATPTNGGATPSYQWQLNAANVGTDSPTYTTSGLLNGQVVTCIMTSSSACASPTTASSAGITMTVNPVLVPSVAIALTAGTNPMCAGSSATFTATPTNGGAAPAYQWQVNGVNAGTNSNTFTTTTLATGQIVTCILTSNATCASPTSATSAGITMTVNPLLVPSVAIALTTGTNPMCAGASTTFTATPTNGGATPAYQWQVDGVNAGTNSTTFTTTGLTNGQIITCILTSNATCASPTTATSAGITMTVNPLLVPSVIIAQTTGSNPMCAGASATFTATPTNGGASPAYQWQVDGINAGLNAPTFTTAGLANGEIVTCILTSNATCASPTTANSAGITMTVNTLLVPSVAIALTTGTNPMCAGSSATFTATPTNGGAAPSYQWQVNGVNAGINSAIFSTTALTNGQVVTCTLTSNETCASPVTASSAGITMTVNPVLVPSVSIAMTAGSNPMCAGSSATFKATTVNEGTTPSYQWQVDGINAGLNNSIFTTSALTNGQIVTCILTSNANCASPVTATSNGINITVDPVLVPSVAISLIAGSNPMCAGSSATFLATPTNGGTTPNYQWQVDGVNVGTNSTILTATGLTNGQTVTCIITSNASCASPTTATSTGITMTVNPVLVPSVAIALTSGSNPMCAGSSATFTATPTNGGGAPTYQWQVNGVNTGTNSPSYSTTALNNGEFVTCILTSSASCASPTIAISSGITMTVNPVLVPSVAIALTSGTNPTCAGTSLTFTATPTNGGATPAYQWQINGVNAGVNSATFNTSALNNGEVVTCILTSNANCASPTTAISAGITMTVNPVLVPSVAIAQTTGSNPMCAGSSATFTATPTNGGATPAYQWQVNGVNAGTNSASFSTTALNNGEVVTCILTSNANCASPTTASSAGITMTVNPVLVPSVAISLTSGTNPACAGSSLTFTATPTNGGTTPDYEWMVNGVATGTNSPTFTTSSLTNGQIVTCNLTSNALCASTTTASSAGITMIVNPVVVPSVSVTLTGGSNPSCAGSLLTYTATPTDGGTTPAYQWQVNGVNAGTDSPTFSTSTLLNGQVVSCILTSNTSCASPTVVTSMGTTISINPVLVPSVAIALTSGTNPMCAGSAATFTATPTNGGVTPTYQWQVNGAITGTNSPTFTSSSFSNGDVVNCVLTSSESCASPLTASSAGITLAINSNMPASVSIAALPAGAICAGTNVTFTANPVNGGTTPVYQWMVNGVGVATGVSFASSTIINGDVVTCSMISDLTCVTGSPATSNVLTMSVNPTAAVSVNVIASPSGAVCPGTTINYVAVANNGGSTPAYQWLVNGTPNGITAMSFSSSSLNDGDMVSCVVTSSAICATGSPATSNVAIAQINPIITASVNISASPAGAICDGTPVTLTATPNGGGTTPTYQWILNGVVVGTGTTYANSSFADNDQVICVMLSNASCATGNPAISNPVIMDVNPILAVGVSIAAVPSGTVCAGTNVTFTATPIDAGANPNYQWVVNGINVGTNSPNYSNNSLSSGDVVNCILTATAPCATGSPATSNFYIMSVTPTVPVSISIVANPAGAICAGSSVSFTANTVNGGATPLYQWYINGSYAGTNSATFSTSALVNGDNVSCVLTSSAACPTGSPASSNVIGMTVNPNLPVSISIVSDATAAVCEGTLITYTATPLNGGVSPSYQWFVNGLAVGSDSPSYGIAGLADGDLVTCQLTSSEVCATGSPSISNTVVADITTNLVVGVTIEAIPDYVICEGEEVTFSATTNNSGMSPIYQWYLNGSPVGINASTYISSTMVNGDVVVCELTSSEVCVTNSPATSNTVNMTVNPIPVADAGLSVTTCSNVGVQLVATGGDTYEWSIGDIGDTISVNPQTSTTYYVTATSNGCSSIDFVDVLVLTAPIVDFGSDVTICANNSITLDAGPNYQTYAWFNGSTDQTLLVDSVTFGLGIIEYSVQVTAFNGCIGGDSVIITIESCAGIEETTDGFLINFYPNPVHDVLNVSIEGELTEDIIISVIDVIGQTTYQRTITAQSGQKSSQIDMSGYPVGVYYINVQTGDRSYVHKLIVN